MRKFKVSIIIPAYNIDKWIDKCLQSVLSQTYENIEVIIIDDGSNDDTLKKCQEWQEKDARVLVISKKNEGPSIARNLGIKRATGDYVSFIDGDDWVDNTFVEKILKCAQNESADIVECDICRVDDRTGKMTYKVCSGSMGMQYSLAEHMKYGHAAMWKCLIKKELFDKYCVEFPNCHSEMRAVYPLLLALGKKIANVNEGLYYYRRFRVNSLSAKPRVNNGDENAIGLRSFDALVEGFKKNNIYVQNVELLQEIIIYKMSDLLAASFYRKDKKEYLSLVKKYRRYIGQHFPENLNVPYITLGGYNLNRILWSMNVLHDSYCRFNFSSLIGIMHPLKEELLLSHQNNYRQIMISRDIYGEFWDIIAEVKPEYIFIDFIEERFDMLHYKDGYITKSDAFDGACIENNTMQVISRKSEECKELWEKSCLMFIEKLKKQYPEIKIVLVKNYLSEEFGDIYGKEKYSDFLEIREINSILEAYYNFFEENFQDVIVIEASQIHPYFTDCNYEYGRISSHLNDIVNRKIAKIVQKIIEEDIIPLS